jgi:hypothetical protein
MTNLPFFALFDVQDLLPKTWHVDVSTASSSHAKPSTLVGGAPTSLEPEGTIIDFSLIDGTALSQRLEWLYELYAGPFLSLAAAASRQTLIVDPNTQSAVNINILPPGGGGYELHVDSNPVTAVLFLSTHTQSEGGLLEIQSGPDHWIQLAPLAGTLAVFDARRAPHRVTASSIQERISAPMNYFLADRGRERPEGLDRRLYKTP